MPDGLLLLAFALTLVVNAVLIVVAIRAMRPGGALDEEPVVAPRVRDDRPAPAGDPSRTTVIPLTSSAEAAGVDDAVARPLADAVITELPVEAQATAADLPTSVDSATARDSAAAPEPEAAPRRRPRARSAVAASATTPRPTKTAGNGRRRRFSLPPLDDDHEKVNRSIESFLSSGDTASTDAAAPESADAEADRSPTTVALVAVTPRAMPTGPRGSATDGDGSPPGDKATELADRAAAEDAAIAAVERSLRSAARGTDQVEPLERGRFRIVLASTGELAARAYLRRVRATVEPLLEELHPPRRLAMATATILGEPVDAANDLVERRLSAIVEASRVNDSHQDPEPRVAPD